MDMDISRVFQTSSEPVYDFFQQPGVGYYIPLYQREYSWDKENIEQLMDDICSGVADTLSSSSESRSEDKIHFMGTIILVTETDVQNNIKPKDTRAIPIRTDNVIDGQQRISTIALLGCCLYQKIYEIKEKLTQAKSNSRDEVYGLIETADTYLTKLQNVFSVDLMRGKPKRKPIIIRGSLDSWTLDGGTEYYKSEISNYLANFIQAIAEAEINNTKIDFPKAKTKSNKSLINVNIKLIQDYLEKTVEKAHINRDDDYPSAWNIVEKMDESELWVYERPELRQTVKTCENIDPKSKSLDRNQKYICSLVQLFAFTSYLLNRCCLTVIKPLSEVRAFDMFQSLNATGTPLTAIETFKPLVVHIADSKLTGFKNSIFDTYFQEIEKLMKKLESASSKNKRTNDYLTLFSLSYEGKSLSKQFSTQRKWLIEKFEKDCGNSECEESSIEDKQEFLHQMHNVALYCQKVIYSQDNLKKSLPELNHLNESEKKLASFCLLYLQDANHKMAHTILSRFYALVIRTMSDSETGEEEQKIAQTNFAAACKIVAAFYTLWRSSLPTKDLDSVYKNLLQQKMSGKKGTDEVTIENLIIHFKKALEDNGIGTKQTWISKAINYLRYDNVQKVCRFVLFVTAQDTILDVDQVGLMKIGKPKSSPSYLEPEQWISDDLKHIEHIAPQKPDLQSDSGWDNDLYENDDFQQIGNLTLLPQPINSSAGNKNWTNKWIYYRHLAEKDPDKLTELIEEAQRYGVTLNDKTIKLLTKASYAHHIKPIVEIGSTGKWDKVFVMQRTECICDILWQRMYDEWLRH